jgi:hypothetical protein
MSSRQKKQANSSMDQVDEKKEVERTTQNDEIRTPIFNRDMTHHKRNFVHE